MMRIELDLEPGRKGRYQEALARLHDVALAEDGAADALVTGKLARAKDERTPCLLDQPEQNTAEELEALSSDRLMPGHQWRFYPSVLPVQESNASGQLGEPGLLRVHHWLTEDLPPDRAAFAQVDLAHWFFGAPSEEIHFLARPDYLQIHLGFPNGGMALLDLATRRPGKDSYYSMHLIGSAGAAYADDHRNAHLLLGKEGSRALVHEQNSLLGIQHMLQEFVGGIRENRAWKVSIRDTLRALATIKEAANV
ncbi:MAG: hypothetical protein VCA35_03200 [Roseibacillus sp.]